MDSAINDYLLESQNEDELSFNVDENPLMCLNCRQTFADLASLGEHMKLHASVEKYFSCDECSKQFSTLRSLKTHKLIHGDVRKFACQFCGKHFRLNHHLKSHLESLHADKHNAKNVSLVKKKR